MTKQLKYLLGNTPEEAEQTHNAFVAFLNKIATSYARSTGLEKGDLFGEGVLGLAKAKASYNPERGSFSKWAAFHIIDALNNYVANNIQLVRAPEYVQLYNDQLNKLRMLLELYTDDNDLVNSIIYTGDMSNVSLPAWAEEKAKQIIFKLRRGAKRAHVKYEEMVVRASFIPEINRITKELKDEKKEEEKILLKILVQQMQEQMTETEKKLSTMIMEGKTNKDIARYFQKTPSWVTTQIKKIRHKFQKKGGFNY